MTAASTGEYGQIISLIPGGGWMGEYKQADGTRSMPVVAWALTERGRVIPMEVDSDGVVAPTSAYRIYHPDSTYPGPTPDDPSASGPLS
jgi:hypothetical protein